ncbi:hypothetical protein [Roseibium sp.]|uniref:hypothetical protein n=1 Tax=Roseibium sp. TaxID=1936156 RepID=UPI003B50F1F3
MRTTYIFLALFVVITVLYVTGIVTLNQELATNKARITDLTRQTVYLAAPQDVTEIEIDSRIRGTPPRSWQATSALGAIQSALIEYPERLLRKSGPALVVAGDVSLLDVEVGGTIQTPNVIILATGYLLGGLGTADLKRTFHHEYSSILMRQYAFPLEAWYDALPEGFSFPETEGQRLAATQVYADDLAVYHRLGFVSDYGVSSFENDVNTYAELLMGDPARLKRLSDEHANIRIKKELILKYYIGIDSDFLEHFRNAGILDQSE